jgi:hypothetical protein
VNAVAVAFTGSLKLMVMVAPSWTAVALLVGTVEVTVGNAY